MPIAPSLFGPFGTLPDQASAAEFAFDEHDFGGAELQAVISDLRCAVVCSADPVR
jgi:hypothetical protein